MKLIIQIPCFNEAETLHRVLADLPSQISGIDEIETLVIDDGSSDGTAAVALGLGVDHVERHLCNRGLAATFASGLETALRLNADIIVNTDGDNQYPSSSIAKLVEPIVAGRADVVVGDRRPGADPKFSLVKRWLQRCGRRVVSGLAGRDLADPVSGFRAFSRAAAERTHIVTGYTYTIESLLQASCKNLAIEFVPIDTNPATRPSRLFRSIPQFVSRSAITMMRVFFMFHPLEVLVNISLVLALVGILPIARFLYLYAFDDGSGHIQSLILSGVLVVLSAITLVAGLLADLISHNRRLLEKTLERLPYARIASNPSNEPERHHHRSTHRPERSAFTLLELIVVMAVLSILVALLLPSVQSAREAARRTQCANHLKQWSLALQQHVHTYRQFPSGGWGKDWAGIPTIGNGPAQPGGWIFQSLPFIEQSALQQTGGHRAEDEEANGQRLQTPLPMLHCPSRRGGELFFNERGWHPHHHPLLVFVARNDYAINGGGQMIRSGAGPESIKDARSHTWPDMSDNTGICYQRSRIRFRDITDGLSNTYAVGEKQIPVNRYALGSDMGDNESAYSGDDRDLTRYVGAVGDTRFRPLPDSNLPEEEGTVFGAAHPAVFQMTLCDGAVKSISYSIDSTVHSQLGIRNDGKSIDANVFQ
ncbi:DUF1559 domain-containing protein [Novipirellula rosea]|uniref:Undecaprenyl-phosphate mannosyltransferase n=1 Tax=Novipirellula rosea TaxID=1031540 RepID=A0ABP8MGX0_9BACT